MLKEAGAAEVHMRISSPPTTDPCFYGVDTPDKDKLIASNMTNEEICAFIEADSLAYLSEDALLRSVNADDDKYCTACFTGKYIV
jgi:amidophosphoribosyltransferase